MDGQDDPWGWGNTQADVDPVCGDDNGCVLFILIAGGGGVSGVRNNLKFSSIASLLHSLSRIGKHPGPRRLVKGSTEQRKGTLLYKVHHQFVSYTLINTVKLVKPRHSYGKIF